jgi:MFS family permease
MAPSGICGPDQVPRDISQVAPAEAAAVYKRVRQRLLPLLIISYGFAFLNRVNVGFAQLQMKHDLGITDKHFGLAAGLFFVTYVCFEIPSNLMVERIGVRKQLLRIMVLWGLTSAATMFVHTPGQYYTERVLLGLFEAGFFPGVILYLSLWLPTQERGKATGFFIGGVMLAGIIGGPLSGLIMTHMAGAWGLAGWQWCFVIEGLPCVVLGVINFLCLADKPSEAEWLSPREKAILALSLEAERQADHGAHGSWRKALLDPRIYLLAFLIFACQAGGMVLNFWMPTIIRELGVKSLANIGYLTAIPFAAGAIGTVLIARNSDRFKERRWHYAISVFVSVVALALAPQFGRSLAWSLVLFSIIAICVNAAVSIFWAVPARYLGTAAAAGGIAAINTLAQFGPFLSPIVTGYLKIWTGSMASSLYVHAAVLLVAGLAMLIFVPQRAVTVGTQAAVAKTAGQ